MCWRPVTHVQTWASYSAVYWLCSHSCKTSQKSPYECVPWQHQLHCLNLLYFPSLVSTTHTCHSVTSNAIIHTRIWLVNNALITETAWMACTHSFLLTSVHSYSYIWASNTRHQLPRPKHSSSNIFSWRRPTVHPCFKWTLLNRICMLCSDTAQWIYNGCRTTFVGGTDYQTSVPPTDQISDDSPHFIVSRTSRLIFWHFV